MRSFFRTYLPLSLLGLSLAAGSSQAAVAQQQAGPPDRANGGPGGPSGGAFGGAPHRMLSVGPPGRWWNDPTIIQQLSLSPDQRSRMDSIFTAHRLELIDAVANVQKAEALLQPLVSADTPNEGAILAQIDKVAEARANLEKAHARMLLALRALLSHDQWLKLEADRPPSEGHHGGFGRGNSPRGGEGPGDPGGPPPDMN